MNLDELKENIKKHAFKKPYTTLSGTKFSAETVLLSDVLAEIDRFKAELEKMLTEESTVHWRVRSFIFDLISKKRVEA